MILYVFSPIALPKNQLHSSLCVWFSGSTLEERFNMTNDFHMEIHHGEIYGFVGRMEIWISLEYIN